MSNPKDEAVKKEGSSNRNSSEFKKFGHYWECCNKNHVARMGKEARDGCREFMASSIAESDGKISTTLRCDACGCHRNFHRKKEELGVVHKARYGACHKNHLTQRGKYALDGCMEFIGSSDDDEMRGGLKCDACGCHRNFHERKVVEDEDRTGGADDDDVDSKAGLYEDCRKNHALDMGKDSYWDGCLEFMVSTSDADPMKCDACGCHRNFHKRKVAAKEERLRKRPPPAASPYYSSDYNDDDDNYVDDDDYYD